jgi:hypothetical protein
MAALDESGGTRLTKWQPPRWLPLALALLFALLIAVGFSVGAGWRTLAVLGTLFTLCFKTAFSGYRAYPSDDSA